ncbi:MAG: O-antigen ligase family protein [Gammaproteobacteria bacterium]|nr:O-antigen ligase family protein [Gammaproteobacteria bacterium]
MIRLTLLTLFTIVCSGYAFRDWFKALCGLILMMAVIEHPDMPKGMLGIQGLNPWNIIMLCVLLGWAMQRRREGLRGDLPRGLKLFLWIYVLIILIGVYRLLQDYSGVADYLLLRGADPPTVGSMISEFIVNTVKWLIPGLLLFDGCRDQNRLRWALTSIAGVYFLLALQVIKWMPLGAITGGEGLSERSLKILLNEVGIHRVNMAVMLAGGVWAIFALRPMARNARVALLVTIASALTLFGLALTGGRAGYATWAVVGALMAAVRWRRYLVIGPILVAIVIAVVPAVRERMLEGFTAQTRDSNAAVTRTVQIQGGGADAYTVTAGRNIAWPRVLAKIGEAPWFGYGREAMRSQGISSSLWRDLGEDFGHPHNAYLQWILDNGIIGAVPMFVFLLVMLRRSIELFADSRSPVFISVGGLCLALLFAQMVGGIGSQTFYPREGTVGLWCSLGLMWRVYLERQRAYQESVVTTEQGLMVAPPTRAHRLWSGA